LKHSNYKGYGDYNPYHYAVDVEGKKMQMAEAETEAEAKMAEGMKE
jgi:hypothetical protein